MGGNDSRSHILTTGPCCPGRLHCTLGTAWAPAQWGCENLTSQWVQSRWHSDCRFMALTVNADNCKCEPIILISCLLCAHRCSMHLLCIYTYLLAAPLSRHRYYPLFTNENIRASNGYLTCPGSQS